MIHSQDQETGWISISLILNQNLWKPVSTKG